MAEPLATVERVAARAGEKIETPEEVALAREMLEAASNEVRHYGRNWLRPEDAPAVAVTITVAAAARGYLNPGGIGTERADAVNFGRGDEYTKGTELWPSEIRMLRPFSRQGGIQSASLFNDVSITARSDRRGREDRGYAPTLDGTKPFPLGIER